jgi:hypothetical protein
MAARFFTRCVMTKKRKPRSRIEIKPIDVLATMADELAEAVELQRPHFPADDDKTLRGRAEAWRAKRYQNGHWPDFAELAKAEAIKEEEDNDPAHH